MTSWSWWSRACPRRTGRRQGPGDLVHLSPSWPALWTRAASARLLRSIRPGWSPSLRASTSATSTFAAAPGLVADRREAALHDGCRRSIRPAAAGPPVARQGPHRRQARGPGDDALPHHLIRRLPAPPAGAGQGRACGEIHAWASRRPSASSAGSGRPPPSRGTVSICCARNCSSPARGQRGTGPRHPAGPAVLAVFTRVLRTRAAACLRCPDTPTPGATP